MNTPLAAHAHCHATRGRIAARIWFGIALALGTVACSKDESGDSMPVQTGAGTSAATSGSGGMPPSAAGGAGAIATAQGGAGASSTSAAGRSGPSGGTGSTPPAGGAGTAAMSGRGGASGMPAASGGSGGGMQAAGGAMSMAGSGECTRDLLKSTVDTYFAALAAHDPKMLPTAATVKFTENGKTMMLGEGLWAKAGMVKFKESLLDTMKCGSVTQAVVPEGTTDIPLAVRLKLDAGKVSEIQTIAVRDGDYFVASNTKNMIALTPWGDIVPEDQRQTREQLEKWIDKYFRQFPMGVCAISNDCKRMENGFTLMCSAGASCTMQEPSGKGVMSAQIILSDVEAGLAAGFTMFQGQYSDVHMVKYSGGMVHGVHTVLAKASSSGWN